MAANVYIFVRQGAGGADPDGGGHHSPELGAAGLRDPRAQQARGGELHRQIGAEEEDHYTAGIATVKCSAGRVHRVENLEV